MSDKGYRVLDSATSSGLGFDIETRSCNECGRTYTFVMHTDDHGVVWDTVNACEHRESDDF